MFCASQGLTLCRGSFTTASSRAWMRATTSCFRDIPRNGRVVTIAFPDSQQSRPSKLTVESMGYVNPC
jgi:hypothetical protein